MVVQNGDVPCYKVEKKNTLNKSQWTYPVNTPDIPLGYYKQCMENHMDEDVISRLVNRGPLQKQGFNDALLRETNG